MLADGHSKTRLVMLSSEDLAASFLGPSPRFEIALFRTSLLNIFTTIVVYFDKRLVAAHAKRWLK